MATTVEKYVGKCQEVVDAKPAYVKNKSNLSECDCIGMDKYAFRECGVSFSTSGTNYSARKQVDNFRKITGTSDLRIGDVVFKAREPGDAYYDLPERYQMGGNEYNGDIRDYYHIGTVKSVYPLRILHMTDPTAKTDESLGKWKYAGSWKKQYISDYSPEPGPEPQPDPPQPDPPEPEPQQWAEVWSENGKPVNTRKGPGTGYGQAGPGKLPVGTVVEIMKARSDGWDYIRYVDKLDAIWYCYMQASFLRPLEEPQTDPPKTTYYTVTIPHLTEYQAEGLMNRYPGSTMNKENG
jgi:hypothetical protein